MYGAWKNAIDGSVILGYKVGDFKEIEESLKIISPKTKTACSANQAGHLRFHYIVVRPRRVKLSERSLTEERERDLWLLVSLCKD